MAEPFSVFSRLHGFEAPEGVFAVFIPERGWCRYLRNINHSDWCWSKKFRLAEISLKSVVLARRLQNALTNNVTEAKVLNLLTLKMWTPKEFIAEFAYKPKQFKRKRGPCGRCGRTISLLKSGKSAKHWCYCTKCHQSMTGTSTGCVKGCVNEGL